MPRKRQKILVQSENGDIYELGPTDLMSFLADFAVDKSTKFENYGKCLGPLIMVDATSTDVCNHIREINS